MSLCYEMLMRALFVFVLFATMSCKNAQVAKETTQSGKTTYKPSSPTPEKLCSGPHKNGTLNWFQDDFASASACAAKTNRPLLIDMWAPWCHTCLSMKNLVLNQPSLNGFANRFVWLALDTDKPKNKSLTEELLVKAWPTFYVTDHKKNVFAQHQGAASTGQFRAFLQNSEGAFRSKDIDALPENSPVRNVVLGDRSFARGDYGQAEDFFRKALQFGSPRWERKPQVLVSLISSLAKQEKFAACVELAQQEISQTGQTASAADFSHYALTCLQKQPNSALNTAVIKQLEMLVQPSNTHLTPDDRSDALRILRNAYLAANDNDSATATANKQWELLYETIQKTSNAAISMTYNWPIAEAAVFLGKEKETLPLLVQSAENLPDQYDPAYRAAWLNFKMKRHEHAVVWIRKAIQLSYGPRKIRVLQLAVQIAEAMGNLALEKEFRSLLRNHYRSLSTEKYSREIDEENTRLEQLK